MGPLKERPKAETVREGLIRTLPDIKELIDELNELLHNLMSNLGKKLSLEKLNRIAELFQQINAQLNAKKKDIQRETPDLYSQLINLILKLRRMRGEVRDLKNEEEADAKVYFSAIIGDIMVLIQESLNLITQIETKLRVPTVSVYSLIRTERYKRDLEADVYKRNIALIEKVEQDILGFFTRGGNPTFRGKLAIREKRRTTVNPLHAHLPRPIGAHRILYNFDSTTKTIELLRIATKAALGLL